MDDSGLDLPQGQTGEVWLRSATQLAGYWNNSVATADALRDGWYRSGDMGFQDSSGYVFLVDRKKDMIISGGENIYSREVENALLQHPSVIDAAVIGAPHEKWGECVKAIVALRPGELAGEADLIAFCREFIAGYKCPKTIEFVDELPRLPTGKISKVYCASGSAAERVAAAPPSSNESESWANGSKARNPFNSRSPSVWRESR